MGVLFAVGAVSGTILSFEMGLLWPGLMGTFGQVIGLPFALECIAFFIEAIFWCTYCAGWPATDPFRSPRRRAMSRSIPSCDAGQGPQPRRQPCWPM
jgi:cytochrome d ubiquinol oxidase subunit I